MSIFEKRSHFRRILSRRKETLPTDKVMQEIEVGILSGSGMVMIKKRNTEYIAERCVSCMSVLVCRGSPTFGRLVLAGEDGGGREGGE
jgi:hypothetical protein